MLNRRTDNRRVDLAVDRTTVAVGLMITFTLLSSLQPVLIAWRGVDVPFLFGSVWRIGEGTALVFFF